MYYWLMHSCIGIHYAKLFWSCKNPRSNHEILVLFGHGFYLTKPILALICLHELHGNVLLPWLIAYGIFTLNSIFQPKAFIKKYMHFNINYIVSVLPFSTCFYWCVTSLQHEGNFTAFPVKVAKIPVSCSPLPAMKSFMLTSPQRSTIICILILICLTTQHSKIVNEYDQEIPQSQTADNPVAPWGRAA